MTQRWGKFFWSTIHFAALGYPENPSPYDKHNYKEFVVSLGNVLPCDKCRKNYQRHLSELPIDGFLDNTRTLFEWTVMFHNIVNKELGKREWAQEEAWAYYNRLDAAKDCRSCPLQTQSFTEKAMIWTNMVLFIIIIFMVVIYFRKKS